MSKEFNMYDSVSKAKLTAIHHAYYKHQASRYAAEEQPRNFLGVYKDVLRIETTLRLSIIDPSPESQINPPYALNLWAKSLFTPGC